MTDDLISKELFDVLACPDCKGELEYNNEKSGLICKKCGATYLIKEGIPIFAV